jgi:ribosomal protein S18 acetylase RimI-like enzyme
MALKIPVIVKDTVSEYKWYPFRREDIPAAHEMWIETERADENVSGNTLEDAYTQFDDPWYDPDKDSLLAGTPEGEVAALGRIFMNPEPVDALRAYLMGDVHPYHRGRGLGEYLFAWMQRRARQRLHSVDANLPRVMRTFCAAHLHDRIELFERHGFQPVRYSFRMRRDLSQPIPVKSLPEGFELRPHSPEIDRAMWQAFNESFQDHWSFEPVTESEWQMFFIQRSGFRPDLTFAVLEGTELVGFSFNRVSPEENAREGIQQGWISDLGVRRPWRKRGIASALICETLRAFRAEGLDYATLGVDAENPTGALRLYESLGFVPVRQFITFEKEVE